MSDDPKGSVCGVPPSIENLAVDYNLPSLKDLFNQKVFDAVVMEFKNLSIDDFGIESRDCIIRFSYSDQIPDLKNNGELSGFRLSLEDSKTGHSYMDAYHAGQDSHGRFTRSGSGIRVGLDFIQAVLNAGGPSEVIKTLAHLRMPAVPTAK